VAAHSQQLPRISAVLFMMTLVPAPYIPIYPVTRARGLLRDQHARYKEATDRPLIPYELQSYVGKTKLSFSPLGASRAFCVVGTAGRPKKVSHNKMIKNCIKSY